MNWKTTLTGLVTALASVLNAFGVIALTTEQQDALVVVALIIVAFVAKETTVKEVFTGEQNNGTNS